MSMLDEEEEDYCPLCMEELDLTDKNFMPCPCGYRVCIPRECDHFHMHISIKIPPMLCGT
jgi:hypothetical protein